MIPRTSVGDGLDQIFVVGRNSFRSLQFDKFAERSAESGTSRFSLKRKWSVFKMSICKCYL